VEAVPVKVLGIVLVAYAIGVTVVALTKWGEPGANSGANLALAAVAAVLGALALRRSRRA
jgi:hypothetical protein